MSETPLLEVRGLSVAFAGHEVVHGIDFSIVPGERVALVGESGSGKTVSALSLLRLAANARLGGQALFNGRDLLTLPESELRAVRGRAQPGLHRRHTVVRDHQTPPGTQ